MPNIAGPRSASWQLESSPSTISQPAAANLQIRLEAAFHLWNQQTCGHGVNLKTIADAVGKISEYRTCLLAEPAERLRKEEENLMLRKLKEAEPCQMRDLMRKYPTRMQRREMLRPILAWLVARGDVGVGPSGLLYLRPREGDKSSQIELLTY